MKISNIFMLLLAGFALTGAVSCVETAEYEPAAPVALAPYYFSTGNGDREDLEENQSSFSILLGRLDATEELTVTVEHNSDIDNVLNVPHSVTFAAGESTANLVVTFDLANIEKRKEYKLDLNLDGIENTPYYLGDLSLIVYYNPWDNIGKGIYTDAVVSSIFGDVDPTTYEVDVQEHPTTKGYYRIVNPYGPDVYKVINNQMDYGKANRYLYIHAEDPEAVYIEKMNTGLSAVANYGYIVVTSKAYQNMLDGETLEEQKEAKLTGTLDEATKNIVMPVNTLDLSMTNYKDGASVGSNTTDFVLVLPGGKVVSDWEEVGFCNYTDGFCGPFMSTPVLDNTYPVLVEYNEKSNLYRIVDPFGPNSGYTSTVTVENNYIVFNMENHNCITVGDVETNIANIIKGGKLYTTTEADMELKSTGITKNELAEAGIGGTFDGKVIRIPGDQILGYYANKPDILVDPSTPVDVVLDLSNPTPSTSSKKTSRKVTKPLQLRK